MKGQWEREVIGGLIGSFELRNDGEKRQGDMNPEHCAGVDCVLDFLLERTIDYGWPMPLLYSDNRMNYHSILAAFYVAFSRTQPNTQVDSAYFNHGGFKASS